MLASLPGRLGGGVFGATGRVFSAVLSTLTVAVFTIYFLADLPGFAGARCCCSRGSASPCQADR